jgi:hypothetical protein
MYEARLATLDEFLGSRDAWDELALSMKYPTIFCSWEWIYTWWEHFGAGYNPVIVLVHDGAVLKGILPLFGRTTLLEGGWLSGRVLFYGGSTEVYPDHLDVICAAADAQACMTAISGFLSTSYRDWDVIRLSLIAEDSTLAGWMRDGKFPFRTFGQQVTVAPYIPLTESFERYIGQLDKKTRYNIRSRRKKLFEQHGVRYVVCGPGEEKQGLSALFELHELRARKKGITSTFEGGKIMAFHEGLIERVRDKGWVSLSLLKNATDTIAASYNFMFGNRAFSYQKGNHPAWGQYGPGSVILHECINDAFSRGFEEYNLLQGNEAYKQDWTSRARTLLTGHIFNSTAAGRLSFAGLRMKERLKRIIRRGRKSSVAAD